jgi:hypothetical protein
MESVLIYCQPSSVADSYYSHSRLHIVSCYYEAYVVPSFRNGVSGNVRRMPRCDVG